MDNSCPDKLDPGTQCGLTIRFTPQNIGRRTANLQVNALPGGFATLPLSGSATAGAQLTISPNTRSFGNRNVGSQTGPITEFTVRLSGSTQNMTGVLNVIVEGTDAPNFQIVYNDCQNTTLQQTRTSCRVGVRFVPVSTGQKTASLAASATPGGVIRATMYGNGT
jgi:plastocyanin domain-containing protein